MKRKLCSALLLFSLLCTLLPAAAAEVAPGPPPWVPASEYAVFPGSAVYQPENWALIETLRADAAAGELRPSAGGRASMYATYSAVASLPEDAGVCFELGLIEMQYALNAGAGGSFSYAASRFDKAAALASPADGPSYHVAELWDARGALQRSVVSTAAGSVVQAMADTGYTLDQLLDCDMLRDMKPEKAAELRTYLDTHALLPRSESIAVELDGYAVLTQGSDATRTGHSRDGRTMVPLRTVATHLGADVAWDQDTQGITITRAGTTIQMTLGSAAAVVNGQTVQMDAAPYALQGTTFIPVRYVAEFFGQKVAWDQDTRTVSITEDKSVAGESNLEAWALPMGAMLAYLNSGSSAKARLEADYPAHFGMLPRGRNAYSTWGRSNLNASSWGIMSREDLISSVASMTFYGHNTSFLRDVAMIDSLSDAEYSALLKNATGMDAYMFPYTKELGEKWGERGILCWDLFRMSDLVQWGYNAGYLTYAEALAMLEPAAVLLQTYFSSWDEAYENYLDGYNWWSRSDVLGQDVWETPRGVFYQEMKADPEIGPIFDDSLFETEVVPVPGVSFDALVEGVLE